ncbi:hypothetical protein H6G96_20095 [Nostoc sp. FACHB-892]|uniref:hypothetical protein n=1 Tax=Nostoc sp. FACHB-892 TaxID=2692843 RepID=UPI001683FFEE|nr:hypothetical protein [Nostoc sp. FACHB-892]MBD2728556.1 hypothetical protein [Nostoc sp. FACHB-892]
MPNNSNGFGGETLSPLLRLLKTPTSDIRQVGEFTHSISGHRSLAALKRYLSVSEMNRTPSLP